MGKIKIIDLFAGVGGLSYGFANDDDFEIIASNEILPDMAKAYELNHPTVKMYCKDIKDFGLKDLQDDFNLQKGEIDLVIGMRGHSQMIPFGVGCKILTLGTHNKMKYFLDDISSPDLLIDLNENFTNLSDHISEKSIEIYTRL